MEEMKQGEVFEDGEQGKFPIFLLKDKKKALVVIGAVIVFVIVSAVYLSFKGSAENPESGEGEETEQPDGSEETVVIPLFNYTPEEIQQLRAYGYTADEIEESQIFEIPAEVLYERALTAIKEEQQKVIDELSDTASPAYQELLQKTWLAGDPMNLVQTDDYELEGLTENVDYIKLPAVGKQLFLRITMTDGTYLFMTVTPDRWFQLRDVGNIVINYVRCNYNGVWVITEIREIIP
jgi:hypothetical protein